MFSNLQAYVEPREGYYLTLQPVRALSADCDRTMNAIIQGDNLLALDLIGPQYKGAVRCAYLDPPYNNQEHYAHYSDVQTHEVWLDSVVNCAARIKKLLRPDGSIWISIDDRQVHYLKVALDEVYGRRNFICTVVWQQRTTRENRKVFSNNHEYLLVYAIDAKRFAQGRSLLDSNESVLKRYKNPDNDSRGPWQSISANVQAGHGTRSQFYEIVAPSGKTHRPPKGRCWVYTEPKMKEEISRKNLWFGKDGNSVPRLKKFLSTSRSGLTPHTLWTASEVGTNDSAKKHLLELFPDRPLFDTPKPEELIHRIFSICTDSNDLVLDGYLGSGTTAAVAHKMGRSYIGIECGAHAATHCVERVRKVIAGENGGVSAKVGWSGGGGFSFYRLERNLYHVSENSVAWRPNEANDKRRQGSRKRQRRIA
jgi:adenine-specific DNA-methyltransferase